MKIDIRDFFEDYQDTEIEIQPDQEFDGEKLIRMTRRELRRKKVRRVTTVLAAAAALVAVVFAAGIGMARETATYELEWREGTRFASGNEGDEKTFSSWIGEIFNSLKTKKVSFGDQTKEPGMNDWDESKQGILLEYEEESEAEPEVILESASESEEKEPAYLEGPEEGEDITLVAVQYGYLPKSERKSKYQAMVTAKDSLGYSGYSEEEIASAWGDTDLTKAYTYVTREAGPGLDYMIQVIQPYEVENRTFSFWGEVTIVKNDMLGEWEATWLTVNQDETIQEQEEESEEAPQAEEYSEEIPEEVPEEDWRDMDHHLLLYHPTKHYLINLSVDATVHAIEELDKMAADIVVVEAGMKASASIHEDINYPDQTFNLNAVQG